MLRGLVIGAGSAALVVAGLTGCSSDNKAGDKTATASAATATSGSVSASAGAGTARVTIDGEPMDVQGQVACASNGGTFTIGVGDAATGIGIVMAEDASTATKDGKTYTVTGTATGVDMANPMQPVTKPFEIAVSCP